MTPEQTIEARKTTHGDYAESADLAQKLKKLVREDGKHWQRSPAQNEALDMILFKVARIVCGNPNHMDHWRDIAGYGWLVMREPGAVRPRASADLDRKRHA